MKHDETLAMAMKSLTKQQSLQGKVWNLLVDFATTDRSEKKALTKIRDDIIETVQGPFLEGRCRVCGCTQMNACDGGCEWVEGDLCSSCQPHERRSGRITYYDLPVVIGTSIFDVTVSRPQLLKVLKESETQARAPDVRISMVYRDQVKTGA